MMIHLPRILRSEYRVFRYSSVILCIPRRVSVLTLAPITFGQIPRDHWHQPNWIDEDRAKEGRFRLMWQGIIYASKSGNCCIFASDKALDKAVYRAFQIRAPKELQLICSKP